MTESNDTEASCRSGVTKLFAALEAMDVSAVRSQIHPDIEWHNSKLPTVRGKKWVERTLIAASRLVSEYTVTHVDSMSTHGNTVFTERQEVIRIGKLGIHLRVTGQFTFLDGNLKKWDDHFSYLQLLRGLKFCNSPQTTITSS